MTAMQQGHNRFSGPSGRWGHGGEWPAGSPRLAFAEDAAAPDFRGRQGTRLRQQVGMACRRRCQESLLCTGARQAARSGWAQCHLEFLQRPTGCTPRGRGAFREQQKGTHS